MADANAISLSEYAIMSNNPLVMGITKSLLMAGSVLADIPLATENTLLVNGVRWEGNLPTVDWAKINGGLTVTKGKPTAYSEQAFMIRNAIDVDTAILADRNRIMDPRAAQISAYFDAVTYDTNDKFINNSHTSGDADAPVGLRERLDNPSVYGVQSELKIDFGGVDLSDSGMGQDDANTFVTNVQKMLDFLGRREGDGVVFYANDDLLRRWERAVRIMGAGAGWNTVVDSWGRMVTKYRNARIVDIGRKADQTTRIITSTETSTGAAGASTFTSLYAVVYGEDRFMGWQFAPLDQSVVDLGLLGNDGTIARTMVDWKVGLLPVHTRCMARGYNIKVA
jgi:hypothetical protein